MPLKVYHKERDEHAEAADQAEFERTWKPAGWVREDATAAGSDDRVAQLEARIAELEAQLGGTATAATHVGDATPAGWADHQAAEADAGAGGASSHLDDPETAAKEAAPAPTSRKREG